MAEVKAEYKAKLEQAVAILEAGVKDMFQNGKFDTYVRTMSQFHHYSLNNVIMALFQNPEISRLASYQTWKRLGLQVREGEKAIKILCPVPRKVIREKITEQGTEQVIIEYNNYRLGNVFDISQCDGELPELATPPKTNSEEIATAVRQLMDSDKLIMFDNSLIGKGANGFFSLATKEIHIKPGMSDLQTFRCLLHEKAHSFLHDTDEYMDKGIIETEAETASFLACSALGFDETLSYSAGYLAAWSESRSSAELLSVVKRIQRASSVLLDWVTSTTNLVVAAV